MMLWWLFLGIREAGIHFNRFSVGCYQSHHSHIPGCNYQGLFISLQTGCAATGPTRRPQEWVWTHWEYSNPGVDQAPDEHDDVASVRSSIRLGMVAASTMRWRFTDGRQTSRTGCIFWPHLDYQRISGNPADPLWPFRVKNNDPRRRVSQQPKQPFRSSTSVSSLVLELVAALTVRCANADLFSCRLDDHRNRADSATSTTMPDCGLRSRTTTLGWLRYSRTCSRILELGTSFVWPPKDIWPLQSRGGTRMSVHYGVRLQLLRHWRLDCMSNRNRPKWRQIGLLSTQINHFWELHYLRNVN